MVGRDGAAQVSGERRPFLFGSHFGVLLLSFCFSLLFPRAGTVTVTPFRETPLWASKSWKRQKQEKRSIAGRLPFRRPLPPGPVAEASLGGHVGLSFS